jgi:hypothetical protein
MAGVQPESRFYAEARHRPLFELGPDDSRRAQTKTGRIETDRSPKVVAADRHYREARLGKTPSPCALFAAGGVR